MGKDNNGTVGPTLVPPVHLEDMPVAPTGTLNKILVTCHRMQLVRLLYDTETKSLRSFCAECGTPGLAVYIKARGGPSGDIQVVGQIPEGMKH